MIRSFAGCLLSACLAAALIGCGGSGPKMHDVSGTVTFDDQPLPEGDIMFVPDDKSVGPEAGKIKDGKYSIKVREGKNKVEIRATREVPGKKGPMGEPAIEGYIPAQYNLKTTLEADVASGKTTHNFTLKK
jgi:hypothetical protein